MGFLASWKVRIMSVGALLAATITLIFSLRRSAIRSGRTQEKIKNLEKVLTDVSTRNEVTREINRMPVDDVSGRLRDKWSRD